MNWKDLTSMKRLFGKIALEHLALGLQLPILVALPLSRGLSLAEIGTLEAILAVVLFCFEVPSGYVADKLGRKYAMAASNLAFAMAFVIFATAQSFGAFLLPFILMGIGFAMLSGADEAYLFDALKGKKQENQYKRCYGRLTIVDELVTILGLGISTLISYFLEPSYVFVVATLVMLATLLYTLFFLPESRQQRHQPKTPIEAFQRKPLVVIKKALLFLKGHIAFVIVLIAFALLDESGRLLWQPKMLDLGYTISMLGVIYAGLKIFSIIGAWISGKLNGEVGFKHFMAVGFISVLAFLLVGLGCNLLATIGLALYFFIENMFRVFRSEYLNQRIESTYRATFLSLNSFSTSTFTALFVIGLGAVANQRLWYGFILLVGVKILAIVASGFLPRHQTN